MSDKTVRLDEEDLFSVEVGPYRYSAPRRLWRCGDEILIYVQKDHTAGGIAGRIVRYSPKQRRVVAVQQGLPTEIIAAAQDALNALFGGGEVAA